MAPRTTSRKRGAPLFWAAGVVLVLVSAALAQTIGAPDGGSEDNLGVRTASGGSRTTGTDDAGGRDGEPRSLSDGSELRDGSRVGDRSARQVPLAEPLTPDGRDASRGIERSTSPDGSTNPSDAADEERPDGEPKAQPAVQHFNLFEGPSVLPAERQNLPKRAVRAGRARPIGSVTDPLADEEEEADTDPSAPADAGELRGAADLQAEAPDRPEANARVRAVKQPNLFRPAGPVRSPTFDDLDADRLDSDLSLGNLRQSLPLSADDPFAPVGIRAGRFTLFPVLEQSVGYSDNLSADPKGEAGVFSQTALSARLLSDWSRHEAEINAAAVYRRNFNGSPEDEPRFDLDGRLRLDIDRDLSATLRGAFAYDRDDEAGGGADGDSNDVFASSLGAELRREVGRSSLSATVDAVREDRSDGDDALPLGGDEGPVLGEDADLALQAASVPGEAGSQRNLAEPEQSFTTYTAGLRAGYSFAPLLKPFVAGSVGRRVFDENHDAGGFERASTIEALRAGLAFDLSEKLYGEVAFGYAWNVPDSGALPTTQSPTVDASLNWSPRRGTDVALTASTFFDPDDTNLTTSTRYRAGLAVRHRARARLDLNGEVFADYRDSDVTPETTVAVQGGFTYWLNRQLAFISLVRHERLDSEAKGGDYTANSIRVGLRFQR